MFFNFPTEKLVQKEQRQALFKRLFRRIFLDDWLVKLTALGITFALWLGVTGLRAPLTTRLSGVTFSPLISNELEITNTPVHEVDLVITGDKRKIDQLNPRDLVVSLDLTDVKEGERTIQITPENVTVDLPSGVKIDKIRPDKIAIKLEKVEVYEVPIRVETEGDLPKGFEIYSTKVTPEKIKVRGPKSSVESLDFISTEKVSVEGIKSDFTAGQTALNIVNPKITLVNTVSVNVFFRIGRKRIERLFVVPYTTESRAGKASVLLFGPDAIVENISVDDIGIREYRTDLGKTGLEVVLPDDISSAVTVRKVKFRE